MDIHMELTPPIRMRPPEPDPSTSVWTS